MIAARTAPFQALLIAERVEDTLLISMDYNNPCDERLCHIKLTRLSGGHYPTPFPRTNAAERGTWTGVGSSRVARQLPITRYIYRAQLIPPAEHRLSGLSGSAAFRFPRLDAGATLDGLSSAMGDSWTSVVNTASLACCGEKSSTVMNNATSHGSQTVDLATDKLNDLYEGATNVPLLDKPEEVLPIFQGSHARRLRLRLCQLRRDQRRRSSFALARAWSRSCPTYFFEKRRRPAQCSSWSGAQSPECLGSF